METLKISTKSLLVSAILLLIILLTGPLGYKFSLLPLQPSLLSVVFAVVGGLLLALIGIGFLIVALKNGQAGDRNLVVISIILGLLPAAFIGPQMAAAGDLPQIHDISTDTENPPVFVSALALRADAPNGSEYGASDPDFPAEVLAEATLAAYPDVQPIVAEMSVAEAVQRSESALQAMGLEIIDVAPEAGRVEATATTFWFGFKDDVVVRAIEADNGTRIDVRSMSRVGKSDIGANAARIQEFLARF